MSAPAHGMSCCTEPVSWRGAGAASHDTLFPCCCCSGLSCQCHDMSSWVIFAPVLSSLQCAVWHYAHPPYLQEQSKLRLVHRATELYFVMSVWFARWTLQLEPNTNDECGLCSLLALKYTTLTCLSGINIGESTHSVVMNQAQEILNFIVFTELKNGGIDIPKSSSIFKNLLW